MRHKQKSNIQKETQTEIFKLMINKDYPSLILKIQILKHPEKH